MPSSSDPVGIGTSHPGTDFVATAVDDEAAPGATASFPFDRMTVERFRVAFPRARWRDDLGAWFVPGKTAGQRLAAWQGREWSGVLAYADERGRDAFAFEPIASDYLEAGSDLIVRTPYSRSVVEALRTVPWARWDPAGKAWRVPFRSWEALRQAWPVIEAAATRAEPEQRRLRAKERAATGGPAAREAAAERRRHRYPVPDDALPPIGRVLMTHSGCLVMEDITGEVADPTVTASHYAAVQPGAATLVWATWRRPTHAELIKAWPSRGPADWARGWWQPDLETLRAERRRAASIERAQATRRGGDLVPAED